MYSHDKHIFSRAVLYTTGIFSSLIYLPFIRAEYPFIYRCIILRKGEYISRISPDIPEYVSRLNSGCSPLNLRFVYVFVSRILMSFMLQNLF